MKKKIAVVLSGCGVYDGTEVHEAVLTLLALDHAGLEAVCLAPDIDQHHVVNHLNGEDMKETRNVLVESARIARGEVSDLARAKAEEFDAVVFPGGFGAAKNLCTFAFDGPNAQVNPDVERFIKEMYAARKPIGLICIAPAIGARVLGSEGISLTIGNDESTAEGIRAMGAVHRDCPVESIHIDSEHRIVSTPAYMLGKRVWEVHAGIDLLVKTIARWA